MIRATARGLAKHPAFLNASAMGTGKTRATAAFCKEQDITPLVVCPKTLCSSWREEFSLWGMEPEVVNYERIRGKKLPSGELVVWDEAQALSGRNTQQAQLLISAVARGSLNILLSATLADNPLKLRAPGYALGLHQLTDFWNWARTNGCHPGFWGGMEFSGKPTYIRGIHHAIFPERGIRLHYADIPGFPECLLVPECIDFSPEVRKTYRALQTKWDNDPDSNALTEQLHARQAVELLKVDDLHRMTNDLVQEGYSVCLFVNFLATANDLHQKFEGKAGLFTGENVGEREHWVAKFQDNRVKVLVLTLASGGPGLNLGDEYGNHQRVALINPGFRADHLIQASGRIHRGNSKSPAIVRILFAKDTVEERVWENVRTKANNISLLNDNDLTFC